LDADFAAVEQDGAGIGASRTGENARQRALACAVLSNESMNFAGAQVQGGVLERLHPPVVFANISSFEQKPILSGARARIAA